MSYVIRKAIERVEDAKRNQWSHKPTAEEPPLLDEAFRKLARAEGELIALNKILG